MKQANWSPIYWMGKPLDFDDKPFEPVKLVLCKNQLYPDKILLDMRYKVNKEFCKQESSIKKAK